jgi:hypothetical protein
METVEAGPDRNPELIEFEWFDKDIVRPIVPEVGLRNQIGMPCDDNNRK